MPRISSVISSVRAREILDSRGFPTVQVDLRFDNGVRGCFAVPSGASTGSFEAIELRDGDPKRYLGRGVLKAVRAVEETIAPKVVGMEAGRQEELDRLMISLDGTPNKGRLGANAILGVSLAYAKASAQAREIPLYCLIGELSGKEGRLLPIPLMNLLNGGRHADNPLDIQEFMILPVGPSFRESLRIGSEVFHHLKKVLAGRHLSTAVGDEGGFAPALGSPREALQCLVLAIEQAGYRPGRDVFFGLDAAANELSQLPSETGRPPGAYRLRTEEGVKRTSGELIEYYETLAKEFPLVSLEDGLGEEDWEGWGLLTRRLGSKIQIVGDDLFVTDSKRLTRGIERKAANAILIKPNQIGTLTETLETLRTARAAGYRTILSHRSGETEDTALADIAVGTEAGQIKTGSLSRSERLAKYNRLLVIEEELGPKARWEGIAWTSSR